MSQAFLVVFHVTRKKVHIHISVHTNFQLNWLTVAKVMTFLNFKINFPSITLLRSATFTTWVSLLALKRRTVHVWARLIKVLRPLKLGYYTEVRNSLPPDPLAISEVDVDAKESPLN